MDDMSTDQQETDKRATLHIKTQFQSQNNLI